MSSVGTRLSLLSAETLIQARQGPVASPRPRRSGRGPRRAAGRVAGQGPIRGRTSTHGSQARYSSLCVTIRLKAT